MTTETILTDATQTAVDDSIAAALGDAYDCLRVWSAWSYGTMGPDDFSLVAEDSDRLREISNAAIQAVLQSPEIQRLIEALKWAVDNHQDSAYWIHQAKTALAAIEHQSCKTCEGCGTVIRLSDNSPDAEYIEIECPDCDAIHNGTNAIMETKP